MGDRAVRSLFIDTNLPATFSRRALSTPFSVLVDMASVNHRPPVHYRGRNNVDPCGGLNNVNNGCQMVFPRMEPGGKLCFLCVKLQDPMISIADKDDIRVCSSLSALSKS